MDTSETYIKMCDCPEIQDKAVDRVKADGGWLHTSAVGSLVNAIAKDGEVFTFINSDYVDIWLPHQEQLQKMVVGCFKEHWGKAIYSGLMEEAVSFASQYPYASMEQLWLAFVMKEKYEKVWDGEEWKSY